MHRLPLCTLSCKQNWFLVALLPFALCAQADVTDTQKEAEQLVYETVEEALLNSNQRIESYAIEVSPIQQIAKLPPCAELQAQVKARQLAGRVPVHLRCEGTTPWSLYASATVNIEVLVVVTTNSLAMGQRVSEGALKLALRPLNQIRGQALTSIDEAAGMVTRRGLRAGTVLRANHLREANQVSKGERVQIVAAKGSVAIRTYGTALSDGKFGDQIQVRNDTSERVIRPWVVAPGQVATSPPS